LVDAVYRIVVQASTQIQDPLPALDSFDDQTFGNSHENIGIDFVIEKSGGDVDGLRSQFQSRRDYEGSWSAPKRSLEAKYRYIQGRIAIHNF
jgi:hypothetical protein